ncbi:MAG: D-alanyl-D-alanine carboxypeptidase [Oscillospiraceae bacterium]|nr:D-alanyl-D-alanine carboxypeptidase [Oscillospiraceae bacterium]
MSRIVRKTVVTMLALILILTFTPVCAVQAAEEEQPVVSAHSAIVINADTGTVVFEKNPLERRAMASTTKIMSALLTLEAGNLDRRFTVDSMAIRVEGSSMGLREGDIVTRRVLAAGMLLPSGNDASQAAAVNVSGSIPEFVKLMNERAEQLGMKDTRFANPSGLDASGHYSTAYDLALLTAYVMKNSEFAALTSEQALRVEFGNPPFPRWLYNNNKLLYMYEGTIGTKTGFTDNARRCLVSAARRNGITLITVTLSAHDDWNDHIKMFDYGFSVVKSQSVDYDLSDFYVNIAGGERDRAAVKLAEIPVLPLTDEEMRLVEIRTAIIPFIYAGFNEGEQVGLLELYYDGRLLKTVPLVTAEACESPTEKLTLAAGFVQFWRRSLF